MRRTCLPAAEIHQGDGRRIENLVLSFNLPAGESLRQAIRAKAARRPRVECQSGARSLVAEPQQYAVVLLFGRSRHTQTQRDMRGGVQPLERQLVKPVPSKSLGFGRWINFIGLDY